MRANNPPLLFGFFLLWFLMAACAKDPQEIYTPPSTDPPFANLSSPQNVVMYELNFSALSNPASIQKVIPFLDSLKALQINVLWLMPIHPIGKTKTIGSPYCVQDYKAVNPSLGSLDDLKSLVKEAHKRNIAVILDWVANHTAWDNPWITQHPEWYTQSGGQIVSPPGTNWNDVADLNYNNADMRLSMIEAMKYWILNANIDGFRCDAADMIPFDFWKQAIEALRSLSGRNLLLLAEGNRTDHFTAGFDLTYAWDFYSALKTAWNGGSAAPIFSAQFYEYRNIPAGKHKLRYTTNHDESAWDNGPVTLFKGIQGALAASVISIFTDGAPLIYTGQEVGSPGKTGFIGNNAVNWSINPQMKQTYLKMLSAYQKWKSQKNIRPEWIGNSDVFAIRRQQGTQATMLWVNIRNTPSTLSLPDSLRNQTWHDLLENTNLPLDTLINLPPFSYKILMRQP